ncbi:MAG: metal ABC transporter ATP-binding protein [Bacillota bacterium]
MDTFPVIEICNLSFTYGCHPVLKDISLTVMAGEAVWITGPNGAGKTTLLKLVVGQIRPQEGEIRIFGSDVATGRWRQRVAYVPQKATFFNPAFPATVMEIVVSGRISRRGLFRGYDHSDYRAAESALKTMELDHLKNALISTLSGGQQQRAFIARALASGPDLLIMDEPTVGVDQASGQRLYSILKKLNREENLTILIVSHDAEGASGISTRQVCLNLHLCTCNTRGASTVHSPAKDCRGLLPAYSEGRG